MPLPLITPADMVAWLVADGLGLQDTVPPYNICYGLLPEEPDTITCIRPYSGGPVETTVGSQLVSISYPYFQVVCRGEENILDTPWAFAVAIVNSFTKVGDQLINGTMYHSIQAIAPPFPLRQDANFRWEIVCNFRAMKDGV